MFFIFFKDTYQCVCALSRAAHYSIQWWDDSPTLRSLPAQNHFWA